MGRTTPEAPHGTLNGYTNYMCRCDLCTEANREYGREYRSRLRAELTNIDGHPHHPNAPHGTLTGYSAYGCRCKPCTRTKKRSRATN